MAEMGHPSDDKRTEPASPKGGWHPSRTFLIGMGAVVFFAGVLAVAGAFAVSNGAEPAAPEASSTPIPPLEITRVPPPVTPEPDLTKELRNEPAPPPQAATLVDVASAASSPSVAAEQPAATAEAAASATAVSPTPIASSWTMPPAYEPPAPAPPVAHNAAAIAAQAEELFGVRIVLEGQDWGADETEQVRNIAAVISAMQLLPRTVTSSVAAHPHGPLTILSNREGRTLDAWKPYGDRSISFYTNVDQGVSGYRPANQVVLATGADRITVAHEVLHAYQFRNVGPQDYVLVSLGEEMRSFMAMAGWRQVVSDDEVRAGGNQNWETINSFHAYEGEDLWYVDAGGSSVHVRPPNPIEAFAVIGALYYARPEGVPLPEWPQYWTWFDKHLGR